MCVPNILAGGLISVKQTFLFNKGTHCHIITKDGIMKIKKEGDTATKPQRICYSHWANGARNGGISIGQWSVFNRVKGAI